MKLVQFYKEITEIDKFWKIYLCR